MLQRKVAILFTATLCLLVVLPSSTNGVKTLPTIAREYPNSRVYVSGEAQRDATLTYAVCDKVNSQKQTKKTCTVYLEKNIYDKDAPAASCQLTLEATRKDAGVTEHLDLYRLGKDKSIVVSFEKTSSEQDHAVATISVVRFSDCKIHQEQLHLDASQVYSAAPVYVYTVVTYDNDTFDVPFFNVDKCGNETYCKATFDADGNIVAGPASSFVYRTSIKTRFVPVESSSALLEIEVNFGQVIYTLIKNNQEKVISMNYPYNKAHGYSTSSGRIGVCFEPQGYATINCTQFDANGELLWRTALDFGKEESHVIKMHNLENNRFLLLRTRKDHSQRVSEIDGVSGATIGHLDIGKFRCNGDESKKLDKYYHDDDKIIIKFFEAKDDEYCVLFSCPTDYTEKLDAGSGKLHLTAKCFGRAELKK